MSRGLHPGWRRGTEFVTMLIAPVAAARILLRPATTPTPTRTPPQRRRLFTGHACEPPTPLLKSYECNPPSPVLGLPQDAVAVVMCGSTKTLALGMPLISVLFGKSANAGILSLPLLIYHATQCLLGSLMIK